MVYRRDQHVVPLTTFKLFTVETSMYVLYTLKMVARVNQCVTWMDVRSLFKPKHALYTVLYYTIYYILNLLADFNVCPAYLYRVAC